MSALANVTDGVWEKIKGVFSTGINWIIDKINGMIDKINAVTSVVGIPNIPRIPGLHLQNGGMVPGYVNGGIIPGSKLPASHDKIQTMLDPGELVLNRAQQRNLAGQLTAEKSGGQVVNITITGNTIYGEDDIEEKISTKILRSLQSSTAIASY